MMELATTRGLLFQKHGAKNLIEARNPYFEERFPDNSDIEERTHKNLQKLDIGYSQDILTDIQWVGERLLENGLAQIIVVDLTRDEIQSPTARVIVPGMEAFGFDPSRVGERLYQVL
jgi:ribosomal protein S12 methylthiotransferase accessory factor YcaO